MTEKWKDEAWAQDFWYSGKVTRRRVVGWGGGAIGAMMLVPAPWRAAFGAAKAYKIGSEQPLSGPGAIGGKTAVVGLQMAADRINKQRRHQRPAGRTGDRRRRVRSPTSRRRKTSEAGGRGQHRRSRRRLPLQHLSRLHAGLAGGQDRQHDQRLPRHHADHQRLQPLQLPPARLRAGASGRHRARCSPRWARSGTSPMPTIPGASRRATPMPREIKKNGGEVVGTTGIPLGTADMTPFLSKIIRQFRRPVRHLLRQGRRDASVNQAYDLGLTKKYKMGRRRRDHRVRPTCRRWATRSTASSPSTATSRCSRARSTRPTHHKFFDEAKTRLVKVDPSRSAARPLRAVELRGAERDEDRHGEVEVRGPQGHHEADRGARRSRGQAKATTSRKATRRCARTTIRRSCANSSSRSKTATFKLLADSAEGQDPRSAGLPLPRGVSERVDQSTDMRSPASSRGAASAPILKTELLTVRFGGLSALNPGQFRGQAATRSAPSSGRTAPARAPSSTA